MQKNPSAFPLGLYGLLLLALCWLSLPGFAAGLERWAIGAACLVPRAIAAVAGQPVAAASAAVREHLLELRDELNRRVAASDLGVGGPAERLQRGRQAVHCAVLAVSRRGGAGEFAELRLDRSYAELQGCEDLVTKGEALVGFLARPGVGVAADDGPGSPARVLLLNHPAAPPLHAAVALPDGSRLRCVVRAGGSGDPAPLRVDLWEDPYLAARLDRAGLPVRTRGVADTFADGLPPDLLLGATRIWGYPAMADGAPLTLGVFVAPAVSSRALSHVVLWRVVGESRPALPARVPLARAAIVYDLPGAANGRHLLVGGDVPDGAAVVQDGCLLGTARALAFGCALVTSFAASRQRWSLILLPDDRALPPRELEGEVVRARAGVALLRCRTTAGLRLCAGHLFTGSNGEHCPAGLWIGTAAPLDDAAMLEVRVPDGAGSRSVEVLVGRGAP